MKKIYIVAPASGFSGGPELSHQLADVLNREEERAKVIYHPFSEEHRKPYKFSRYNVSAARVTDVEPSSIVVLPEIYTPALKYFPHSEVFFWWQSVDNFFKSVQWTSPQRFFGAKYVAPYRIRKLRQRVHLHLYQSEYARLFLEDEGLRPNARLSDFLADDFLDELAEPNSPMREDVVTYSPRKGIERTELVLRAIEKSGRRPPRVVALTGMSRDQMRNVLRSAKLYIDFGDHPGKDRIPREAAAMGACVLVNRRGSAGNDIDIPIGKEFKIEDRVSGFEELALQRIYDVLDNFTERQSLFDQYRMSISRERATFLSEVNNIFPPSL